MKKVLVITYYWPPSGGGGVQRWLKFTKYLPEFDWRPIVYTPEIQNAPAYDESLLKDISDRLETIKTPIWEPYSIYRLITGRKKENLGAAFASDKRSNRTVEGISNWIRSNFFIPDARKFWIRPSVNFLVKYLGKNHIDAIVTTGPPHSMHLIGLGLKNKLGLRWIADFRDPWTDIDYYSELKLTGWAKRRHRKLEKKVIENADFVISISESNRSKLLEKACADIAVISNGYDPDDVTGISPEVDKKFSIAHIGTFMANRNPECLWEVLQEIMDEEDGFGKDFELVLVGHVDSAILDSIEKCGLKKYAKITGNVSHEKAVTYQKKSQVLLISVNKSGDPHGMVTGKVFEYLVSGRPILAIGPEDGGLARILKETNTGVISDFNDKAGLKQNILEFYVKYKSDNLQAAGVNLDQYSRKNLTGKLADLLNKLV
ncbi:MAG: glycosyltransferase family 4 protein [Cytophagales bacterium]|nr:glycosyltransferase family 4 protein [Cytophagales bacterium]